MMPGSELSKAEFAAFVIVVAIPLSVFCIVLLWSLFHGGL